jgi:hypothetical protein
MEFTTSGSLADRYCPTYSASLAAGNVTAAGSEALPTCAHIAVEPSRTIENNRTGQPQRLIEAFLKTIFL